LNFRDKKHIDEIINVSGTMTALGASSVSDEVIQAVATVLPKFVDMVALQQEASRIIHRIIGAESGIITACSAAGIAISVAACMTGPDMAKVEQLPDTAGLKDEVLLQRGHSIWFGGSIPQMIRISGAKVIEIGDATRAGAYQLEGSITEHTVAAVYVVSHHTVQYGLIDLETFSRVAHSHDVPVIVDAASESNMKVFFDRGADIVCYSGHKFLAGPTSGIIAGRSDLVKACLFHQYHGIGRAMKVGKESIVGATAALERWERLDHAAVLVKQKEILNTFTEGLLGIPGLTVSLVPDPAESPTERVKVSVEARGAGLEAFDIAKQLKLGSPVIYVRDNETIDAGYFFLDPTCCTLDQAKIVVDKIKEVIALPDDEQARIRSRHAHQPNDADSLVERLQMWLPETGQLNP